MVFGIAYNEPVTGSYAFSQSSADVLDQVKAVEEALITLGHEAVRIPFTRDLARFTGSIREKRIEAVFNLCETVDEDPTLAGHPAAVLEVAGIAFTGSPSHAITTTTDKVTAKRLLRAMGLSTPDYMIYPGSGHFNVSCLRFPVIIKPRFEDASIGIDQESVCTSETELKGAVGDFFARFGTLLIEEYIEGREFNVSLFGYPDLAVLPPAEIDFSRLPGHLHRIVGYRAKWDTTSIEYEATPRVFPKNLPAGLAGELAAVARQCAHLFGLRDYGRVDVRVDDRGRIYVLEVNANPCLTPDAGFASACREADMPYAAMVDGLVQFVCTRMDTNDTASCPAGQG